MSEKRRALGRGLGALIPNAPTTGGEGAPRPVDVFFPSSRPTAAPSGPSDQGGRGDEPDGSGTPNPSRASGGAVTNAPTDPTSASSTPERDGDTTTPPDGGTAEHVSAATPGQPVASADGLAPVPGAEFAELPLDSIRPNPKQPRAVFDQDDMDELVHSIREIGVLQPVVVRRVPADATDVPDGVRFELIMGERRWRASREAGLDTVPAIVKDTQDDDLLRDALLENLHRSQLNPLEEAAAYQQLLDDFGCSHEELATRIGRSRPQISNTLRLLRLPPIVARRVAAGVLSAGHARALLGLADGAAMERLAQRIVAEGLSVRSVEEIVSLGGDQGAPGAVRRGPRAGARHPQLDDLAARLSDRFDTRVQLALGQRKGRLTVEFASVDDLHRILDVMGLAHEAPQE